MTDNTEVVDELLPCKICGGYEITIQRWSNHSGKHSYYSSSHKCIKEYFEIISNNIQGIIDAWNGDNSTKPYSAMIIKGLPFSGVQPPETSDEKIDTVDMLQDYVEFEDGSCAIIEKDGWANFSDGTPSCKVRLEGGKTILLNKDYAQRAESIMIHNTEAVEKLAEILTEQFALPDRDAGLDYFSEPCAAILAAFQADPLAYVKPKPISWGRDYTRNIYHGNTTLGPNYLVFEGTTDENAWRYRLQGSSTVYIGFPTLEAAQAAAFEHLCETVKELF